MDNVLLKASWYEILGRISGAPDSTVRGKMMDFIAPLDTHSNDDELQRIIVKPINSDWVRDENLELQYGHVELWRAQQILEWFQEAKETQVSLDNLPATRLIDWKTLEHQIESMGEYSERTWLAKSIPRVLKNHLVIVTNFAAEYGEQILDIASSDNFYITSNELNGMTPCPSSFDGDDINFKLSYEKRRGVFEPELRRLFLKHDAVMLLRNDFLCSIADIALTDLRDVAITLFDLEGSKIGETGGMEEYSMDLKGLNHLSLVEAPQESLCSLTGVAIISNILGFEFSSTIVEKSHVFHRQSQKLAEPCRLANAKLVFSSNVGRSGSKYLAGVFETVSNPVVSLHEPACPHKECSRGGAVGMQMRTLAESYDWRRNIKLPMIFAELAHVGSKLEVRWRSASDDVCGHCIFLNHPNGSRSSASFQNYLIYAETNPNFKSWFYDVVLDELRDTFEVHVLIIRKYIPAVLKSLYETGFFSKRNGYTWMETANSVNAVMKPLAHDDGLDAFDLLLSYILNTEMVTRKMMENFDAVEFLEIRSEDIYSADGALHLLELLDLQPTEETHRIAGKRIDKYMENSEKSVAEKTNMTYCEERLGAYLERASKLGIEIPRDMVHLAKFRGFQYH
mmetsp:Transcript_25672/g.64088  ORF Transcript_25672/g.64088 Transcript_25672/m.64088 type:complete len:624 (+) Transcript_25672:3-1874(+)